MKRNDGRTLPLKSYFISACSDSISSNVKQTIKQTIKKQTKTFFTWCNQSLDQSLGHSHTYVTSFETILTIG